MRIDRQSQREILILLAEAHPHGVKPSRLPPTPEAEDEERQLANMLYLEEHGLITAGLKRDFEGDYIWVADPRITARGLDFLADDGGLSAILGTVTIKLHDDTLRALLASKIAGADGLGEEERSKLLQGVKDLPAESIKHLTMRLIDKGLENMSSVMPILQSAIQGLL